MRFRNAYLQEEGNRRTRPEESLLQRACEERGIPVHWYTAKRIERRQLPLDRNVFLAGDVKAVQGALKQLKITVPAVDDYPTCLECYRHRKIWKSTLDAAERAVIQGGQVLFIKPAGRSKCFTGRVFMDVGDFYHTYGVSRREPVWCSEPVGWRGEFRVYVRDVEVLAVAHYAGDPAFKPDMETVRQAVAEYRASETAPAAFGIDFGVFATGETALIEVNDGYALGAYEGVDYQEYAEVILTRWAELVSTSSEPPTPQA